MSKIVNIQNYDLALYKGYNTNWNNLESLLKTMIYT